MGIARGSNIVRAGLVYGYDTGYGAADNATSTRFYPGEPTTNLYTNSDFSNGETGWTFASWDGNISHTATTIVGPNGKTVSANKLTVNAASSYSHFHQYNGSKYTSGNTYTTSAWVKGYGTFAIKSHWGGNTNFTMTGEWQRVSMTVTATSSSASHFPYFAGEGLTVGSDFYITDTQTELKSHATPYVYSGSSTGSRSNTASLIDLKRTTNISVGNISFDSTGQPNYDGSDDFLTATLTGVNLNNGCAIEGVLKRNTTPTAWRTFFNVKHTSNNTPFFEFRSGSNAQQIFADYYHPADYITPAATLTTGDFGHAVACYDGNGTIKMYFNGSLVGTKTGVPSFALGTSPRITVGRAYDNTRYTDISAPVVKVYDSPLSAVQVEQNYKAYKNRFNI